MPSRKKVYPTDTEAGIRTITQIRNLKAGNLTDEEFVKMFFDRFQAKALVMGYVDEVGQFYGFGRMKRGASPQQYYRSILHRIHKVFQYPNTLEIE